MNQVRLHLLLQGWLQGTEPPVKAQRSRRGPPHSCRPRKGYTRYVQASIAFFRMGVLSESGGSALMNSWGSSRRAALGRSSSFPPGQAPQPRGPALPSPPALTTICATSSAFLERWKEPPWALLQMAWVAMHTLCTRLSLRAGSCKDNRAAGAAEARGPWAEPGGRGPPTAVRPGRWPLSCKLDVDSPPVYGLSASPPCGPRWVCEGTRGPWLWA